MKSRPEPRFPTFPEPLDQNEVKARSWWRPGCQIRVPGHLVQWSSWPPMFKRQGSEPSVRVSSLSWFKMGSSKKHKEKDKDRDREKRRDRERKHRERDSNKDRDKDSDKERRRRDDRAKEKRSHPAEDDERVEKKKVKREDYDDLYEYAVEESTRDDHGNGMVNLDWNACSMFKMLLVRNIDLWLVTKLFLSVFSNVLIR